MNAVVAPIDMNARALEMGIAGCTAHALGSRSGQKAVEFRHLVRRECRESPSDGSIGELVGGHAG
jgi:hypothetical protein